MDEQDPERQTSDDATEVMLEATTALLPPLLAGLDALAQIGRHLHPPGLSDLLAEAEPYPMPIETGLATFSAVDWPEELVHFSQAVQEAARSVLAAFADLVRAPAEPNPVLAAYRALRHNTRALETLYPLAATLPPVSRFFLSDTRRGDDELVRRLAQAGGGGENVGIVHASNRSVERGGFSLYVPEYYDGGNALPLVVALHGGSGHGRGFLWTWLKDARSRGALLISPTSREATWSLMGPDVDSDNLDAMVRWVCKEWRVDEERILLTGMSDGGTFSYVSGFRTEAPFTHLAPVSASFHPMLVEMADHGRLNGLPIYLVHGALDWMFDVNVARLASEVLAAAGAAVTYREIADLSHTYPREENDRILDWLFQ